MYIYIYIHMYTQGTHNIVSYYMHTYMYTYTGQAPIRPSMTGPRPSFPSRSL